jgi:two-component system chemotaxis response regulator CheB
MFSTLTSRGAATTIEALSAGASDYLTKPEGASSLQESMERLRLDLVPRVKALARVRKPQGAPPSAPVAPAARISTTTATRETRPPAMNPASALSTAPHVARPPLPTYRPTEIKEWPESGRGLSRPADLLVIGVSTGGPNALARLMPNLPATLSVPVLIVQHMPPLFTRMLAERLDASCPLKVREAEAGAPLLPGEVWVARGDWHMEVARQGTRLILREHQGPPVNSCRPAVDILFESAMKACGGSVVSVVLTGMGQDGMKGARAIREAGGLVLAQDEDSSVVWGMPGAVAMAGIADAVLPLDAMAARVLQALRPARASAGRIN